MVLQDSLVGTDITEHTLLLLGFSTVTRIFAIVWVGLILGLMPVQAIWSRRKVDKLRPTRMQAYASTVSGLILIGAITFAIDWFSDRTGIQAAKNLPSSAVWSAWAGGTFLTCSTVWFAGMLQRKSFR